MYKDREEHVSLWHPWLDKPGQRHSLGLWGESNYKTVDEMLQGIGGGKQYSFCSDILQEKEVPSELVLHDKTESFICRTGQMTALKVRYGKNTGFLVPGIVWGCANSPGKDLLHSIQNVFDLFGYEAITPASLSEKVLRSTLPYKTCISRPSVPLRQSFLDHSPGARIDVKQTAQWYPEVYEYDINKAYLRFSRSVPSPFNAPLHFCHGDSWFDFATSWLQVTMTAHSRWIHPIQIKDEFTGDMREPRNGETFTRWCWKEEIFDCLIAGYTLEQVHHGYGWNEKSGFMREWSDILWDKYQQVSDQERELIKKMMVGLPGRFLKRPESYTLVPRSEAKKGDIPVIANWQGNESPLTNWLIRTEYDKDSAQLTPVGSYIIMRCRQEIYKQQLREQQAGNELISSYVDMYRVARKTTIPSIIGSNLGQYKEIVWRDVNVVENRIFGLKQDKLVLNAPGVPLGTDEKPSVFRLALEQEMRKNNAPIQKPLQ